MLQNSRLKKDGAKKIIIFDLLIYLEDQPSPWLNQISFCIFKGREGEIEKFWLFEIFSRV